MVIAVIEHCRLWSLKETFTSALSLLVVAVYAGQYSVDNYGSYRFVKPRRHLPLDYSEQNRPDEVFQNTCSTTVGSRCR